MGVDEEGRFLTQRTQRSLARVDVAIERGRLRLSAEGHAATVALSPADGPRRRVTVWNDTVEAISASNEADAFISELLAQRCSLVHMPDDVVRQVDPTHARPGDRVGFADGFPVLVASLASLADLNNRLEARGEPPVSIERFRANVVIDGDEPFREDGAATIRIGALTLRTPKRCARCQVITIDQRTGERGREPLRTLASYRTEENAVHFAMNAIPELDAGETKAIAVGDPVSFA